MEKQNTHPPLNTFERHPFINKLLSELRLIKEGEFIQTWQIAALCNCNPRDANDASWRGFLYTAFKDLAKEQIVFEATVYTKQGPGAYRRLTNDEIVTQAATRKSKKTIRAAKRVTRTLKSADLGALAPEVRDQAFQIGVVAHLQVMSLREKFELIEEEKRRVEIQKNSERRTDAAIKATLQLFG